MRLFQTRVSRSGADLAFSGTPFVSVARLASGSNSTLAGGSRVNSERVAKPSALSSAAIWACVAGSSSVIQVASSALRKRPFSLRLRARMM